VLEKKKEQKQMSYNKIGTSLSEVRAALKESMLVGSGEQMCGGLPTLDMQERCLMKLHVYRECQQLLDPKERKECQQRILQISGAKEEAEQQQEEAPGIEEKQLTFIKSGYIVLVGILIMLLMLVILMLISMINPKLLTINK
jgi:hypothetical protein